MNILITRRNIIHLIWDFLHLPLNHPVQFIVHPCECEHINGIWWKKTTLSRYWRDKRRMREVNGFYSKEVTTRHPNASSHIEFITFLTDEMGARCSYYNSIKHERTQFLNLICYAMKKLTVGTFTIKTTSTIQVVHFE